jgi:hypothetical protein
MADSFADHSQAGIVEWPFLLAAAPLLALEQAALPDRN